VDVQVEVNGTFVGHVAAAGPFTGTVPARAGSEVCAVAINRNRGRSRTAESGESTAP
jgi:hypothetical protein